MKWKSVKDGLPKKDCLCWVSNENYCKSITAQYNTILKNFQVLIGGEDWYFPVVITHYIELPESIKYKGHDPLLSFNYVEEKTPKKRGRPKGSGKKRGRKPKVQDAI